MHKCTFLNVNYISQDLFFEEYDYAIEFDIRKEVGILLIIY
jgi:hypothetical protein